MTTNSETSGKAKRVDVLKALRSYGVDQEVITAVRAFIKDVKSVVEYEGTPGFERAVLDDNRSILKKALARIGADAPDLLEAIKGYMAAVVLMNEAMKDGINVHGALSNYVAAEDKARAAIARAKGGAE